MGKYKGRKPILTREIADELRKRANNGEPKTTLAREYRISRETLYQYLRPI
jgi:DNA invertase Pin-like site-specific DNA recombinase